MFVSYLSTFRHGAKRFASQFDRAWDQKIVIVNLDPSCRRVMEVVCMPVDEVKSVCPVELCIEMIQ